MQTLQASSKSCSDSQRLNIIASGVEPLNICPDYDFLTRIYAASESLDIPVDNSEKSDGSSNITVVWRIRISIQVFLVSYLSVGP
jgi:hypothetical protein